MDGKRIRTGSLRKVGVNGIRRIDRIGIVHVQIIKMLMQENYYENVLPNKR